MGQNKVYISSRKNDGNVISLLSFSFNQTIVFTAAACKNDRFFPITKTIVF